MRTMITKHSIVNVVSILISDLIPTILTSAKGVTIAIPAVFVIALRSDAIVTVDQIATSATVVITVFPRAIPAIAIPSTIV